jgi:protein subunit release factor A
VGLTLHRLATIMEGDLDEMIDAIHSKFAEAEFAGDTA